MQIYYTGNICPLCVVSKLYKFILHLIISFPIYFYLIYDWRCHIYYQLKSKVHWSYFSAVISLGVVLFFSNDDKPILWSYWVFKNPCPTPLHGPLPEANWHTHQYLPLYISSRPLIILGDHFNRSMGKEPTACLNNNHKECNKYY